MIRVCGGRRPWILVCGGSRRACRRPAEERLDTALDEQQAHCPVSEFAAGAGLGSMRVTLPVTLVSPVTLGGWRVRV